MLRGFPGAAGEASKHAPSVRNLHPSVLLWPDALGAARADFLFGEPGKRARCGASRRTGLRIGANFPDTVVAGFRRRELVAIVAAQQEGHRRDLDLDRARAIDPGFAL